MNFDGKWLWIAAVAAASVGVGCKPPPPPEQKVPVPASVKSFTASPAEVEAGGTATLSWEVEDATSLAITTLSGETVEATFAASGSAEAQVDEDTVFILTARGEGGSASAAAAVVVKKVTPAVLLSAVPREVEAGQRSTLVWNAPGASAVVIKDASGAELVSAGEATGSVDVAPGFTTTYTLEADGRTAEATVSVRSAIVAFTTSAQAVAPGDPVTLQWQVGGAEEVALFAEGRGELARTTEAGEIADGTFVDTAPTTLPSNGLVTYRLEATQGSRVTTATRVVYVGADPRILGFQVPGFAKIGGVFNVAWQTQLGDSLDLLVDGVVVHHATSGAEVASGTYTFPAPEATIELQLRVTNQRGGVATSTATVSPVGDPTFQSFTATPTTVATGGDAVAVSWNVTNARHVRITAKGSYVAYEATGVAAESGTVNLYPNELTEYVLEADNTVGDAITPQSLQVDVTTPAELTFSPNSPVPEGAPITLTGATVSGPMTAINFAMKNVPGDAFIDISETGNLIPFQVNDDTVALLVNFPQPFATVVNGVPVSGESLSVSVNGWMVFSDTTISGPVVPGSLPTTTTAPLAIMPYFYDLQIEATSTVHWRIDTETGKKRLIVQWTDIPFWSNSSKRATFQVQLKEDGEMIYAYDSVIGLSSSDDIAVGVLNQDETDFVGPDKNQMPVAPQTGDTFRMFGNVPLPVGLLASTRPVVVRVGVAPGAFIQIEDTPDLIPWGQLHVSEVNFNPDTSAPLGEWFEVTNYTNAPIDLQGWTLEVGGATPVSYAINQSLILPPNGVLVFGQSGDPTQNGGVTVDHVYPSTISLGDTTGTISLSKFGGVYSTSEWDSSDGGGLGVSARIDRPRSQMRLASGVPAVSCDGTGTYGAQTGTPGQRDSECFPFSLSAAAPNQFQSIINSGTQVGTLAGTSCDTATASVTFPRPVKIGSAMVSQIWVSANGFVSLTSLSSSYETNNTTPSTSQPNGIIAPFWDDLVGNTSTSKVLWEQFDPDGSGTPNGDEYTLVSWEDWAYDFSTTSLNFQIKFIEGTGDIEFHYGSMTGTSSLNYNRGYSATTWLEALDGKYALAVNVSSSTNPGIDENSGYRFTFAP